MWQRRSWKCLKEQPFGTLMYSKPTAPQETGCPPPLHAAMEEAKLCKKHKSGLLKTPGFLRSIFLFMVAQNDTDSSQKKIWIGVDFTGLRPNAQISFKLDSMGLVSLSLLLPRCYLRIRSHANYSEVCYRPNTAFLDRAGAIKSPYTFHYKAPFPSTAQADFCPRCLSYLGLDFWVRLWYKTFNRDSIVKDVSPAVLFKLLPTQLWHNCKALRFCLPESGWYFRILPSQQLTCSWTFL